MGLHPGQSGKEKAPLFTLKCKNGANNFFFFKKWMKTNGGIKQSLGGIKSLNA